MAKNKILYRSSIAKLIEYIRAVELTYLSPGDSDESDRFSQQSDEDQAMSRVLLPQVAAILGRINEVLETRIWLGEDELRHIFITKWEEQSRAYRRKTLTETKDLNEALILNSSLGEAAAAALVDNPESLAIEAATALALNDVMLPVMVLFKHFSSQGQGEARGS